MDFLSQQDIQFLSGDSHALGHFESRFCRSFLLNSKCSEFIVSGMNAEKSFRFYVLTLAVKTEFLSQTGTTTLYPGNKTIFKNITHFTKMTCLHS